MYCPIVCKYVKLETTITMITATTTTSQNPGRWGPNDDPNVASRYVQLFPYSSQDDSGKLGAIMMTKTAHICINRNFNHKIADQRELGWDLWYRHSAEIVIRKTREHSGERTDDVIIIQCNRVEVWLGWLRFGVMHWKRLAWQPNLLG